MDEELIPAEATADAGLPAEPIATEAPETDDWTLPPDPDEADEPGTIDPVAPPAKDYLAELNSPYIQTPEQLQSAVADATFLLEVVNGKQSAAGLVQAVLQSNPTAGQRIINELIPFIEQQTGKKFDGGQIDPVKARLDEIEKRDADWRTQQQKDAYSKREVAAQGTLLNYLSGKLKDGFLEGEQAYVLQKIGGKIGIPAEEVVGMIEKGDYKAIDAALKAVKKEEREAFNARAQRALAVKRRIQSIVPKTVGSKSAEVKGSTKFTQEALRDPKIRAEYYEAVGRGEIAV